MESSPDKSMDRKKRKFRLSSKDIATLQAETDLNFEQIKVAWQKFSALAGNKGYVNKDDLRPIFDNLAT